MTEFPLSRQYFVHSSNSYVTTLIIMSQHSFSAASASWCHDQSFHVMTASLFRLCCNIVLYYLHFYRDPESLLRHRLDATKLDFLLQLVLMLRYDFLVLSIFAVATQFSCRDKALLCLAYSFCRDLVCYVVTTFLFIVFKYFSRHIKVCCDLVSLYSSHFYVATLRFMSRHRFISSV